jgi:hypothetical protein
VAGRELARQVGSDDGVGRGVCVGMHFDADDELYGNAERAGYVDIECKVKVEDKSKGAGGTPAYRHAGRRYERRPLVR